MLATNSTVYILGSSGFIGKSLLSHLRDQNNCKVLSAGRNSEDVYIDLSNDLSSFVEKVNNEDIVVLLASISSPDICNNDPIFAKKINVTSTETLIEKLSRKGVKTIFASTDGVFGRYDTMAYEESQLAPFGAYSAMKADVENKVKANPLVKVVRFSYVLGEGDTYTNMLSRCSTSDKPLVVFEGFERSIVALSDVVKGIENLIKNWSDFHYDVVNFCGPSLISRDYLTKCFKEYVAPELDYEVDNAPNGFWEARPKTINMQSNVFSTLLGRTPMSVEETLKNWRHK